MKFKLKGKRFFAMCLALILGMTSISFPECKRETEAASKTTYVSATANREQINFNRDWKFIRQDVEGAEASDFDDSSWVPIGLPHNFSIPYAMQTTYYVGYGWYRKTFEVPDDWSKKRVELEFEGVFQVAEVYVNGEDVGTHEGGYTGFSYDITDYLTTGSNVIAVRVNNIWQHDLAPRGGDHQYTGGIYRDVYLNVMDDVHVTWYGTFVTTPDLTNPGWDESAENIDFDMYPSEDKLRENLEAKRSNVAVQTEVKNDSGSTKSVRVTQQVVDKENQVLAEFSSETKSMEAGETYNFNAVSNKIENIELWSPDNPYVYQVYTTVYSNGAAVDTYESPLGFRWVQWLNDGFYLNGEKTQLFGANAHQDHAGWCDAVSDEGFYNDISMIKEAGMNLIRGSHYPHDPAYATACDEQGLMFWSECCFWGYGGGGGKDDDPVMDASDWMKDPYPQSEKYEEAFEESCMDVLRDMIRINRNHPSVVNWSMGNEVFFTGYKTQNKCKALVNKMRNYSHELDPTRKAAMGGVQRSDYDDLSICDIAGYNGDGGSLYDTRDMPNIVSEYGSKTADRPGEFRPYYRDIEVKGDVYNYTIFPYSAGLVLWCAFHHGTIAGIDLARMGMIDYYRLPLKTWYWYRQNMGSGEEPEFSKSGTATKMKLTASADTITNDGKKDAQLIVSMMNDEDEWVSETKDVILTVKSGPGVFPGGKTFTFTKDDSMRDGKASIEFRSYYSGDTVIVASAEGLPDTEITIHTKDVTGDETDSEPEGFYNAKRWASATEKVSEPSAYGASNLVTNHPIFPSSGLNTRLNATDENTKTSWVADAAGSGQYWMLDLEIAQNLYKAKLSFDKTPYPYTVEVSTDGEAWTKVAQQTKESISTRPSEETIAGTVARFVKVTFTDVPENEYAFLSEIELYGNVNSQVPQYQLNGTYLSELDAESSFDGTVTVEKESEKEYELDGKFTWFEGTVRIDEEEKGSANVKIQADDMVVYDANLDAGEQDSFCLSVNGVKKLKMITARAQQDSSTSEEIDAVAIKLKDAKFYGAIRDISINDICKVNYKSMDSMLCAGTTYEAKVEVKASNTIAREARGILGLYDAEGRLEDISIMETGNRVQMVLPDSLEGYEAKFRLYRSGTLGMLSKTTAITRDPEKVTASAGNQINNSEEKRKLLDAIDGMLTQMEQYDLSIIRPDLTSDAAEELQKACEVYCNKNASDLQADEASKMIQSVTASLHVAYEEAKKAAQATLAPDSNHREENAAVIPSPTKKQEKPSSKKVKLTRPVIKKLKNLRGKKIKVILKKKITRAKGYQIRYSVKKSMKSAKIVTIRKSAKLNVVIKKCKKKKIYYVQARAYQKTKGKKYYSSWSSKRKVKVRK